MKSSQREGSLSTCEEDKVDGSVVFIGAQIIDSTGIYRRILFFKLIAYKTTVENTKEQLLYFHSLHLVIKIPKSKAFMQSAFSFKIGKQQYHVGN